MIKDSAKVAFTKLLCKGTPEMDLRKTTNFVVRTSFSLRLCQERKTANSYRMASPGRYPGCNYSGLP